MNGATRGPVWIHPPRFWKATEGKSEEEVSALLARIEQLLAEGKTETLLQYDFVTGVGYPYPNAPTSREQIEKSAA
jgi:hypothetical protein